MIRFAVASALATVAWAQVSIYSEKQFLYCILTRTFGIAISGVFGCRFDAQHQPSYTFKYQFRLLVLPFKPEQ